jgi:hypothetical protein
MRIINTSDWRTDDLRAIVSAALKAAGVPGMWRGELYVHTSRKNRYTMRVFGRARLGHSAQRHGLQMWLELPTLEWVELNVRGNFLEHVCQVAHHEALHIVGARHGDMTEEQAWCKQSVPWAKTLVLRPALEMTPVVDKVAAFVEKIEHVRARYKRAVTRLKRATTIAKKWERRLKLLEKRHAKSQAEE